MPYNLFIFLGVVFQDFLAQATAVKVGINLSRAYTFMAQHTLYGSQVGAAFQQMSSKRMTESVGADCFLQPNLFGQLFNDVKDHDA